jgi:hypothetical protein
MPSSDRLDELRHGSGALALLEPLRVRLVVLGEAPESFGGGGRAVPPAHPERFGRDARRALPIEALPLARARPRDDDERLGQKPPGRDARGPRVPGLGENRIDPQELRLQHERPRKARLALEVEEELHPPRERAPEAEARRRVEVLRERAALLHEAAADARVQGGELGRSGRERCDLRQLGQDLRADLPGACLVQVGGRDLLDPEEHGLSEIVDHPAPNRGRPQIDPARLAVDEDLVEGGALVSGQRVEEQREQPQLAGVEIAQRGPRQEERPGRPAVLVGELRDGDRARGGRRGPRDVCHRDDGTLAAGALVEHVPGAREDLVERHRRRERSDHAHVREVVVALVEVADVLRRHPADVRGLASRGERERVGLAVDELQRALPRQLDRVLEGADHLVVDGALLLQTQRAVGVFRHPVVRHLPADLLVGVVGVKERVELGGEDRPVGLGPGDGVEVVARPPLLGEGTRGGERHRLDAAQASPAIPLAEEKVLLGVRLAHVGRREAPDPEEALRGRLDAQVIERERGRVVDEARPDRSSRRVEIDVPRGEALDLAVLREAVERDARRRAARAAEAREESDGDEQGLGGAQRGSLRTTEE